MKILVDMNLSPEWIEVLRAAGFEAAHWSDVGDIRAKDQIIMAWAHAHDFVVFTHDLDFGALLATTGAAGPSVIQVRTQEITPGILGSLLIAALRQFRSQLERGALIIVDEHRTRARILPFHH